jgi:hypothetical protein
MVNLFFFRLLAKSLNTIKGITGLPGLTIFDFRIRAIICVIASRYSDSLKGNNINNPG